MYYEEGLQSRKDLEREGWRSWLARLITMRQKQKAKSKNHKVPNVC